jgi:hypothetical protein
MVDEEVEEQIGSYEVSTATVAGGFLIVFKRSLGFSQPTRYRVVILISS